MNFWRSFRVFVQYSRLVCSNELFVHFYIIMFLSNIIEEIVEVDYDLSEYGSMQETTNYAKAIDKAIAFSDVTEWFDNNVKTKHQVEGIITFVD